MNGERGELQTLLGYLPPVNTILGNQNLLKLIPFRTSSKGIWDDVKNLC